MEQGDKVEVEVASAQNNGVVSAAEDDTEKTDGGEACEHAEKYESEFPSYLPCKKFVATKRGLNASPAEETKKKLHRQEDANSHIEDFEKKESSPRTSSAVSSIL